jgi:hypothetical protein
LLTRLAENDGDWISWLTLPHKQGGFIEEYTLKMDGSISNLQTGYQRWQHSWAKTGTLSVTKDSPVPPRTGKYCHIQPLGVY